MKSFVFPTSKCNYEIEIIVGLEGVPSYDFVFIYRKCWPCEDGIYEPPSQQVALYPDEVPRYLHYYLSPKSVEEACTILGLNHV